jgi:hypothetical protein
MPSSTTSWKPSSRISRANASRSSTASAIVSPMVSHPSRFATSAWPAGPQSVSSFFQMRWATSSTIALRTRSAMRGSRSSGISALIVGGREVTIASRFSSMPSRSLSIGSTNFSTPSRRSLSVTSSRSIPASASALRSGSGSISTVGVPSASTCAWSAAASSVAIGIVFTVSAPYRPSTYNVSGYAGFFTPVEAHSGRCTAAPASRSAAKRSPWNIAW